MNCPMPAFCRGRAARRRAQGMTLAEVVVAVALCSLMVLGLVGGYISSLVATEKSVLSLAANTRALGRLEDTHGAVWNVSGWPVVDQLAATNFPPNVVVLDLSGQGTNTTYATNYTTIAQVSLTPPLRRVRIDCVWHFQSGGFSSLFTNTVETLRGPD